MTTRTTTIAGRVGPLDHTFTATLRKSPVTTDLRQLIGTTEDDTVTIHFTERLPR